MSRRRHSMSNIQAGTKVYEAPGGADVADDVVDIANDRDLKDKSFKLV
jgi:hypothetical protein